MPLESGTELLKYHGDPALGFGTAGNVATASPIGVLDLANDGFRELAHATRLMNKDLYDAKKKEWDDTYARLRDVDLSTDKLLDNDREEIIKNDINPLIEFLTKYPHAVNPHTQEEIKQNIEFKKLQNKFKDDKAKGQTRYIYKPLVEKAIAENTFDREDMRTHYDSQFNKPLSEVLPYGKHYTLDVTQLKGGDEEVVVGVEGSVLHTDKKNKDNFYTTYTNTLSKLSDPADKGFAKGLEDEYSAFLRARNMDIQHRDQLLTQAESIADPIQRQKAIDSINGTPLYGVDQINLYNNRATQNNTLRPDKAAIIIDPTKTPTPQEYLLIKSINQNVSQPLQSYEEKTSGRYATDMSYRKEQERLAAKGFGSGTASDLINVVNPFMPQDSPATMYEEGIKGAPGYEIYKQSDIVDGKRIGDAIRFGGNKYEDETKIVKTKDGRKIAKVDGKIIEYDESTKEWKKASIPPVIIDDRILKSLGGDFDSAELEGNRIKIKYTTKDGTKEVNYTPMSLLKAISPDDARYKATIQELNEHGLINLDDPETLRKAMELIKGNQIDQLPGGGEQKTYMYNGKKVSSESVRKAAERSGMTEEQYIKQLGLK